MLAGLVVKLTALASAATTTSMSAVSVLPSYATLNVGFVVPAIVIWPTLSTVALSTTVSAISWA